MAEVESVSDGNSDISIHFDGHEEGSGEGVSPQASVTYVAEWAWQELGRCIYSLLLPINEASVVWQLADLVIKKYGSRADGVGIR